MQETKEAYQVLLYYLYTPIENPTEFAQNHLAYCKDLELKGRILIGDEGINGTVSGTVEKTNQYVKDMQANPLFKGIKFKIDQADDHVFNKMHCRPRTEIVALELEDDINPHEVTGEYLNADKFREALLDENTVVLDARNDYEYDLGHFRGAIRPDIRSFRELPQWVQDHKDELMEKRVVTYCTGGIRCEKFSGYLVREGFKDVGQLDGGIATYGKDEMVKGDLWDGKMYVFDKRISVPINQVEEVIVGVDYFDGTPCERYINCANPRCNKQILTNESNELKYLGSCSHECRVHEDNIYTKRHNMSEEEYQERLLLITDGK
ncbi:hypothetical protein BFC19_09195 [Brochothrix thermosphacta]|uniref:oxygen-dependent tRNA uridine(34) hydroxylase TrhO n=1 Tax=Brochothrix thermosphacta TaxID=2756 RepID=UPI000E71570D|nr:rhodanese-related sulfurtransferase [Brochothrix thermosphacta]ANZ95542.1 hypothetical protein BFC19_09195 [Brochothrix thermosphacta]